MDARPEVRTTVPVDTTPTIRPAIPPILPILIQLLLSVSMVHLALGTTAPPITSQMLLLRQLIWICALNVGMGWLVRSPLLGCVFWIWSLVLAVWALAATHLPSLWMDALVLGLTGPIAHLVVRRRQRQRLLLQEELEALQQELGVRRTEMTQAEQGTVGLRKRFERYAALQTVAQRLNTLFGVEPMMHWIAGQAFALIGKSDICLAFLVDQRSQTLALRASHQGPQPARIRAKHGDVIDQAVLRSRRPILVDDIQKDFRFPRPERERAFRSAIAAPLMVGGKVLGVVRLDSTPPSSYTQDDLRFLDVFLELCAAALANAQLIEETQHLAATDSLTGLALRRVFLERWERELTVAQRLGSPISLLLMDIDHFKAYNDDLGHTAGDLVLQGVAGLLQRYSPPDAVIARYGGEEFIVMLPGLDRTQATAVAERVRQTVAGQPFILRRAPTHVTISIGVAQFPVDGSHATDVLQVADRYLYQAKAQGRNRTCSM